MLVVKFRIDFIWFVFFFTVLLRSYSILPTTLPIQIHSFHQFLFFIRLRFSKIFARVFLLLRSTVLLLDSLLFRSKEIINFPGRRNSFAIACLNGCFGCIQTMRLVTFLFLYFFISSLVIFLELLPNSKTKNWLRITYMQYNWRKEMSFYSLNWTMSATTKIRCDIGFRHNESVRGFFSISLSLSISSFSCV